MAERIRQEGGAQQKWTPRRNYKVILRFSLDTALAEIRRPAEAGDRDALLAGFRAISPYLEVPTALCWLRTRYRLAINSNIDDDLIAGTVAGIDFVVTGERAQAHKCNRQLFQHARSVMDVDRDDSVHVAMGQFTNLKVCRE